MASSAVDTLDTMVTIKVSIEGQNKRLKMPLRDLGAAIFPDKLRKELQIPSNVDTLFERYSDSAAAFVTLDPKLPSVYKQLYRAAKAKQKLRIKATVMPKQQPTMSRQATVEDEIPGTESETSPPTPAIETSETPKQVETLVNSKIVSLPYALPKQASATETEEKPKTQSPSVAQIQRGIEDMMASRSRRMAVLSELYASRVSPGSNIVDVPATSLKARVTEAEIPVTRGHEARTDFFTSMYHRAKSNEFGSAEPTTPKQCPYAQANSTFTVFCNSCSRSISNYHYHCGVCDDGDFDLCLDCTDKGVTCSDDSHWMIKRTIENGKVSCSTTETLPPKVPAMVPAYENSKTDVNEKEEEEEEEEEYADEVPTRTCNCCIQEMTEENFVTCTVCDDYDLCLACHTDLQHGHDPKHAFAPVVEDITLGPRAIALLQPGRNVGHHAICDGCEKYIYGVRHKCLDCPDWDYCATCIVNAKFIHPSHRFVPIYEPLGDIHESLHAQSQRVKHHGIYCDGPLCNHANSANKNMYIIGDRYKCAVCHDTDFCAACEASPSNQHNKTHPLIKFKTAIRNVSVTTMGDHIDGHRMKMMGDRLANRVSKATETRQPRNAATQVQTVADLRPSEPVKTEEVKPAAIKSEPVEVKEVKKPAVVKSEPIEVKEVKTTPSIISFPPVEEELKAHFVRDTVPDGTTLPPNHVFEQTWFLVNSGKQTWPAGCSVKFVGGDNMCAVDPEHPASVHELVSSGESTVCYTEVAPDVQASFTVLMRTPSRPGKVISYWRLTGPNGVKFGHKLWCDINVAKPEPVEEPTEEKSEPEVKKEDEGKMVFPKLEKESPSSSVHESSPTETAEAETEVDDFEDVLDEDEKDFDDETEDGFFTDEEYDILDASDDEYLAKAGRK